MFTKIGQILPDTLRKNGMAPKVARARVFTVFEEAARRALPGPHSGGFKPLQLVDGTLTVACKSSAVASALRAAQEELRAAVREGGGGEIERFRFLLAPWR